MKWQLQQAKARFSEVVDAAVKKGPQIVTRRGVDTAVVVSLEEWTRTKQSSKPNLKDLLLGSGPRFDDNSQIPRLHFKPRLPEL
jgi:prevent-host-death family protein